MNPPDRLPHKEPALSAAGSSPLAVLDVLLRDANGVRQRTVSLALFYLSMQAAVVALNVWLFKLAAELPAGSAASVARIVCGVGLVGGLVVLSYGVAALHPAKSGPDWIRDDLERSPGRGTYLLARCRGYPERDVPERARSRPTQWLLGLGALLAAGAVAWFWHVSGGAAEGGSPQAASIREGEPEAVREEGPPEPDELGDARSAVRAAHGEEGGPLAPAAAPASLALEVACVDPRGEPVGGAALHVRDPSADEVLARAVADASGRAAVELASFATRVVLRAELGLEASSGDRELRLPLSRLDGGTDGVVRLVLHPLVALRGRVVDEAGAPAGGARVSARTPGVTFGGGAAAPAGPVLTDDDGAFELPIDGVPSRVAVEAARGELRAVPVSVHLPGGAAEELRLVLRQQDYEVTGTVRTPDGCPVDAALVLLRAVDPEGGSRTSQAGADGSFRFELKEPGSFLLAAKLGAYATSSPLPATIEPLRRTAHVDLTIVEKLHVAGRIVRPAGEPWVGIPVGGHPLAAEGDADWLLDQGFGAVARLEVTFTDDEGAFRLEGLHADSLYELICTPDPDRPHCWVRESPARPGASDLEIVVDEARIRGGVLAGTATREGEPVRELSFTLFERLAGRAAWTGSRGARPTLEGGTYRLEGLVIGHEYLVEARAPAAAPLVIGPWTATGEEHRADLSFGLDGELRVWVRHPDGRPARDWLVSLAVPDAAPHRLVHLNPRGVEDHARFAPLAAGRYVVSAELEEHVLGPKEVDVVADRTSELELVIESER